MPSGYLLVAIFWPDADGDISMDGDISRENLHRKPELFSHEIWGFPVNFPWNQSIDSTTHEHADGDGVLLAWKNIQHSWRVKNTQKKW